ncbi:hypothetical protein ACOMHN_003173 [Nucella lapillus]
MLPWRTVKLHHVCHDVKLIHRVAGEQAEPALFKPGTDAALRWSLPPSDASIITISRRAKGVTQALFFCFMRQKNISIVDAYKGRVDVLPGLGVGDGLVAFTLKNVTPEDAGSYVCVNGVGETPVMEDCGQMLVVVGPPTDVRVLTAGPPVEGEDLTLECAANSTSLPPDHNLPPQVQWFDSHQNPIAPGGQKEEVQRGGGGGLIVRSVRREDVDLKFSCRVSDGLDEWSFRSADYVLVPEYAPKESDITMDRHEAEVRQGGSLQVQCSATCNPNCTIIWEKEEAQDSWYAKESEGGLLDLTGVQRVLAGNLRCRAENIHGTAAQKFLLVVHYAPNLHQLTINGRAGTKANLKEKSNVTVVCEFDSSPAPSVDWLRLGGKKRLLQTDDLEGQAPSVVGNGLQRSLYVSQLTLIDATCSDTGLYQCEAKNALGSGREGQADLHIVCMPRNTYGETRLKELYLLPASAALMVRFQVEAYPRPEIVRIISEDERGHRRIEVKGTWVASANVRASHPYLTDFDLRMQNPIATYFDRTFYLEIENSEGTKTLAFKLREKGVPKPPRNVTAARTGDTWVRLHWIPGFHGGKPQTFLVQYRDTERSEDGEWTTVPSESEPGHTYTMRVLAHNHYGESPSVILTVTTVATAAAGTDGGAIAGAVITVIIILVIVAVVVFIFVIRPRRIINVLVIIVVFVFIFFIRQRKRKSREDFSKEPMLTEGEKNTADTTTTTTTAAMVVEDGKHENSSHTDTANNNAGRDTSTEALVPSQTSSDPSPDERPRNQDGLIYADLDLVKPEDTTSRKPKRKDTVNYETIDFTREAPMIKPDPDQIELASDEEELPSRK